MVYVLWGIINMEHRLYERYPTEIMVRVVVDGQVAGVSRTIEISSGGVRIYNPGIDLHKGNSVDVDFFKLGFPKQISCCMHAVVIHHSHDDVGLMFTNKFSVDPLIQ